MTTQRMDFGLTRSCDDKNHKDCHGITFQPVRNCGCDCHWIQGTYITPLLQNFIVQMQRKLNKKAAELIEAGREPGWDDVDANFLMVKLAEETGEFARGLIRDEPDWTETVDMGNLAAMLFDKTAPEKIKGNRSGS